MPAVRRPGPAREEPRGLGLDELVVRLDAAIRKVGHNVKIAEILFERQGLKPTPFVFDTLIAAYLLNAWALRFADSSLVAAYTYLQPVITVVLAAIFLGEVMRPVALAAGAMIFAGVWLSGRPIPPAAPPIAS